VIARRTPARLLALILTLGLAACGGDGKPPPVDERDPAVTAALGDPVTIDPDLASQNRGGAALGGGGPVSGEVPVERITPEVIGVAKAEALKLAGGTISPAPKASGNEADPLDPPEALALTLPGIGKDCLARLQYGFIWAARLPDPLTPYPRAHARLAAGSDQPACRLRLASFTAPAGLADALDFHHARARQAGFAVEVRRAGKGRVLRGSKAGRSFAIHLRQSDNGTALVDIVSAGN
jgi:hypothetical protein